MVQKVLIKRTVNPNLPPTGLMPGELAIEMDTPTRLWVGVPPAQDPAGRKLLFDSSRVGVVIISDAPPLNIDPGQLWWEADTGITWLWYDDGSSQQWVQAAGGGSLEEAPVNTKLFARRDAAWAEVVSFPEALVNTKLYGRKDAAWAEVVIPPFPEAPVNTKLYGRKDAAWSEVVMPVFPEAPVDAKTYGRKNAVWSEVVIPPFPEAPVDAKIYGRRNAAWAEVVAPASIPEAPVDAKTYGRKNAAWAEVAAGIQEAPVDAKIYGRQNAAWTEVAVPAAVFPAGTVLPFFQAAAPTGWTKLTTQNDKALRVVSGNGGVAGGTNAFSTVMAQTVVGNFTSTIATMPSHNHAGMNSGGGSFQAIAGGAYPDFVYSTGVNGGSGAHNHTIAMAIQYIDVILASKN